MTLSRGARKVALSVHVTASVAWIGAVGVFLALAIVGVTSDDESTVRGAYIAMQPATLYVIVPLAFASLASGIVQSVGTPWGLVRHYWVLVKLVLTVLALVVLLLQLSTIDQLANAAAARPLAPDDLSGDRASMVLHSGLGLLVLSVPLVLSIFKPRGMTPFGRRKEQAALT